MDRKSLAPFLIVLGFVFLAISAITIWSMFFNYSIEKGIYVILSIPLLIFSFITIFYGFYSMFEKRITMRLKGLILLIDGLIPIITAIIMLTDVRLVDIHHIRLLVLFPLTLAGLFIFIYGIFLIIVEKYFNNIEKRRKSTKILGIISSIIGITNIISYIILIQLTTDFSQILSFFWLIIGGILIYFGIHLIIKKVDVNVMIKHNS